MKGGRSQPSCVGKQTIITDSDSFFCYRCGGDGHIGTRCKLPENPAKVIQKLRGALRKSKEERNTVKGRVELKEVGSVKRSSVHASQSDGLLRGLVGPSMMVNVTIEGQPCKALLDSGSRVTIIFESWYSRHISNVPIHPLADLAIWGLSDTDYPYSGYVTVDVGLPSNSKGISETISVLALVCPDPKSPDPVPVIIGTNSQKLCSLLNHAEELEGPDGAHTFRIRALASEERTAPCDPNMGVVKLLNSMFV